MNGQRGIIKAVYAVILCLLGVILWFAWRGHARNFYDASRKFDTALTDTLVSGGIQNSDIVSRVQREEKTKHAYWVSYTKEILLRPSVDGQKLVSAVEALAAKHGLAAARRGSAPDNVTVDITSGQLLLSRVVLVPAVSSRPGPRKRFALVIDDVGNARNISGLSGLGIPVTFAILPREPYSRAIARDLAAKNIPFILHLPMEPDNYPKANPGKAALLTAMNATEIQKMFAADLASVPGAAGVSNHMGSRFSADAGKMKELLALVKESGLFYFDSYTTPKSAAGRAARELKLPFAENQFFVDLKDDPASMRHAFEIILKKFRKTDRFIAIGHVHKKNLVPVLKNMIPQFREQGIEFVYLTELIEQR